MANTQKPGAPPEGFLERVPDAALEVDAQDVVRYANGPAANILQRELGDVVGRPFSELIASEDPLSWMGLRDTVGEGVDDAQIIFQMPNGDVKLYRFNAKASPDGTIAVIARAGEHTQAELANATRWAASEQDKADAIRKAHRQLEERNQELRCTQIKLNAAFEELRAESEKREKLEEELRLAQKLEAIGQLSAGVAHEINTPMQYIGDNLRFVTDAFGRVTGLVDAYRELLSECEDVSDVAERRAKAEKRAKYEFVKKNIAPALEQAADGVKRVSEIVQAMKAFSRSDGESMEPLDLNHLISSTLVVARAEYKEVARVETHLNDVPTVEGFAGQLSQVILNLVINASHAIADQHKDELGTIRVTTLEVDDRVRVEIEDDGGGIPDDVKHRVFDPFFTTKEVGRGTGQGLALARSVVVERHGGVLAFDTEVPRGTTFSIELPRRQRAAAPADGHGPSTLVG